MVQRSSRILCGLALALGLVLGYGVPAHSQDREFDEEALKRDVLIRVPDGGADLSVEELIRDIGKRMGMIPAIAEAVKGKKVRFYTNAELNFYTIVEVLRTHDIELIVKEAGNKRLLEAVLNREVQAKTGANPGRFIRPGEELPGDQEIVTAVFYFEHIDQTAIQQAQTAVRALMTRDPRRAGHIIQVPGTNAIIITDFASSVEFYLSIARAIDQPVPQLDYKIVQVNFALADELAVLVNNLTPALDLEQGGGSGASAQPAGRRVQRNAAPGASASPGQPQVVADSRTNKLVVLALPADIAKIERLIRELDVEVKPSPRNFHVYKVINANALDLADQLNLLFGGSDSGFSSSRSNTSARDRTSRTTPRTTLNNRNARQQTTQPRTNRTTPRSIGSGSLGSRNANNPGQELIETRIVPDETTNSLLIQAAPEDYRDILS
ncbi:MAG: secretin N-terminal domain-containing protein, partial [Planctomycetota bacterium]